MTIRVFEELNRLESNEYTISNVEYSKINTYANETKDTMSLVYKSIDRTPIRLWSRIAIDDGQFNWEVIQTQPILIDKENGIYEHRIIIGELTHYLTKIFAPNLFFNQFLGGDGIDQFANLYEVLARVNRLVPFETVDRLQETRLITSFYDGDTIAENLMPMMTDRLEALLKEHKDVPEFQFENETVFDIFNKIIGMTGGVLKVICTDGLNKVLDVIMLDDTTGEEVDIKDYDAFSSIKSIENYATAGEITTNNIVDNKSLYVAGADYFKHIQAEDKVIDESDAIINSEFNIYKLKRVSVKYKNVGHPQHNKTEDITEHVVNNDQWNILPIVPTTNEPATSNTLKYQIDSNKITNFGQNIRNAGVFQTSTLVWENLVEKFGYTDTSDLRNYLFQVEFIPFQKGNRMHINQLSFIENNKEAYLPVNIGGRINEANRVIKTAQNKVSRAGAREIQKRCYHARLEDTYPLNAKDLDTQMSIIGKEVNQLKNAVEATYYLTRDINKISEYVGVNTEKWWTDVEIGKSTVRNEIYKDHIIFATDIKFYAPNDTALNGIDAENYALNLFENNHIINNERSQAFLISSQDIIPALRPIKTPIFMTGNRHLSMYLDFLNQTFVDNKIVNGGSTFSQKDVERGVRYTLADGRLSTLNLAYGYRKIKDEDIITANETRNLPEAQELINIDEDDVNYFDPLIKIGDTVTSSTQGNQVIDQEGESKSFSVKRWFYTEQSISTQTYSIPTPQQRLRRIRLTALMNEANINTACAEYNISVRAFNVFGVEVLNVTRRLSGFLGLITLRNKGEQVFSFAINADISSIDVNISARFNNNLPIPIRTTLAGSLGFKELNVDYLDLTTVEQDGLYVDKNQNETLGINYQLNYITAPEDYGTYKRERIVLGDAITTNNPFLLNNNKSYTSFKVYKSSERYGIYESEKKGELVPDAVFGVPTEVVQVSGFTTFEAKTPKVSNISLNKNESYAIIGIRNDGKEDFMYAVNPRDDQEEIRTEDKIYVFFRHKNPLEV